MAKTSAVAEEATQEETQEEPKKYVTFTLGVPKRHEKAHLAVVKLAGKLGCKPSDLAWDALDKYMSDPPSVAPAGASQSSGTRPGFAVLPVGEKGAITGVKICHVGSKALSPKNSQQFFPYTRDDAAALERAKKQARRAALYITDMVGLEAKNIKNVDSTLKD